MCKILILLLLVLIYGSLVRAQYTNKVVNGTDAKEGEFPYMVSMRKNGRHDCGGAILDETHILTAAHCIFGTSDSLSVQYGDIRVSPDASNVINVLSFETHENYDYSNESLFNDVAILTLGSPLHFNDFVQQTILPTQKDPTPADETGTLTGWGLNGTGGVLMETLQKVELSVYSDESCESAHSNKTNRLYHICAGVPEGGKGQCTHDSGSPLVVNGVQRGIVSWSVKPCTVVGFPGVYVNVASYVDWICERSNCKQL